MKNNNDYGEETGKVQSRGIKMHLNNIGDRSKIP